jgi:eukaryotic-like serine/threonine-protein kinase
MRWTPALELDSDNPVKAMVLLEAAAPYELGQPPQFQLGTMYPVSVRGEVQLAAHNGAGAAAEFQKFLDHPGLNH